MSIEIENMSNEPSVRTLCALGSNHKGIEEWAAFFLSSHRVHIGIEPPWSILVHVICPSYFQSSGQRAHEASIVWDSEVWFAHIDLCCNLSLELRQWVLIHELFELWHWRTGDAFHDLASMLPPSELRDMIIHRFYQVRNQEIEQEVGHYMGKRRPSHLTVSSSPSSSMGEDLITKLREWRVEDEREEQEDDEEESMEPNILTLTEAEMENFRL